MVWIILKVCESFTKWLIYFFHILLWIRMPEIFDRLSVFLFAFKSSVIYYKYSWKFGYDLKKLFIYWSIHLLVWSSVICHSLCPPVPLCVCSRRTYRLATELPIIFCNKYLLANYFQNFVSKYDLSVCLLGNYNIQSGKNYSVSNETKWNE